MTATLCWNRLLIEADGDDAFASDVKSKLPQLLKLPYPALEIDLGRCVNLGQKSFKAVGLQLVEAAGNKKLLVHAPRDVAKWFKESGLSALVDVRMVERMSGATKAADRDADGKENRDKDETHPPSGDKDNTFVQDAAKPGILVDAEDNAHYPVEKEVIIGREPPSHPVFAIPTISKRHFRIYRQGPGYFIEDLRSTNGTYLNGNPLTQPQPLGEGDEIVVAITLKHPDGARRFRFTTKD